MGCRARLAGSFTRSGDAWRLEAGGRELRVSNLDKLYWPDDGITCMVPIALAGETAV